MAQLAEANEMQRQGVAAGWDAANAAAVGTYRPERS